MQEVALLSLLQERKRELLHAEIEVHVALEQLCGARVRPSRTWRTRGPGHRDAG